MRWKLPECPTPKSHIPKWLELGNMHPGPLVSRTRRWGTPQTGDECVPRHQGAGAAGDQCRRHYECPEERDRAGSHPPQLGSLRGRLPCGFNVPLREMERRSRLDRSVKRIRDIVRESNMVGKSSESERGCLDLRFALLLSSCMILSKLLNLSVPQFPLSVK